MKEIESRLISISDKQEIRMRVTWEINYGIIARLLLAMPKKRTVSAIYVGSGTVWRIYPDYSRCTTHVEAKLADIAARLTSPYKEGDENTPNGH